METLKLEGLEERSVPATLYFGLASNYTITSQVKGGTSGLDKGDTVTWTSGSSSKTGLEFGKYAFTDVTAAETALGNSDTLKVAANAYSFGNVNISASGATFDIPAGTSGFSLTLTTSSSNLTLTGTGSIDVTGSSGSNNLTGNSADNNFNGAAGNDQIQGNGGNDTIVGGAGQDVAIYNNNRSNYTISVVDNTITVSDSSSSSNDGTDTVTQIQKLEFNDGTVRTAPSKLRFGVGSSSTPVGTSLVFGNMVLDGSSSQGSPSVTLTLSGGSTSTDGNLTGGSSSGITISGSGTGTLTASASTWAALNTYLNSGLIKYNSKTNTARTITITAGDGLSVNGYCALSATAAPSFTSSNSTTVTYGDKINFTVSATGTPSPTFSITTGSLPTGVSLDSATGAMTGSAVAGSYSFTITASSGSQTATQAFTLTVNKAALTVTAAAKSKTYGASDPTLTYSVTTGALVGSDAFTGALSRTSGENVGSYAINQGTLSAGSNYTVTYATANLTVSAKALTVTAAAKSKTYGSNDPTLTYSITTGALVGSDAFTGALSRTTGENVGSYAINQGTLSAGSNYTVTYASANLTVSKATLSISADAKAKTYGDSDPSLTYQVSGLKNSDNSSIVTGALTRATGENAGTYTINQGSVAASANYNVAYNSANLTVNKATLSISADAKTKIYGDTDPSLTYQVSGLKNSDTSSVVTGALTRATGENAGTYTINQGSVAASANYNVAYTSANLTVNKATLSISADAKTKTYGDTDPTLTYQVSGLKMDDKASVVTGTLARSTGENVGAYNITQGNLAAGNNYDVAYTGANLNVSKRAVTVTANNVSGTYGTAALGNGFAVANMASGETIGAVSFATNAPTSGAGKYQAGSWSITPSAATCGTFNAGNYNVSYANSTFTVARATLNVSATGSNKVYNDNASATVSLSDDHLGGDAIVVTPASVTYADANVGFGKTITASGLILSGADAANYSLASSSVTASGNITGSGIVNNVLTIVGTGNDDEVIIALNPKNTAQLNVIWTVNAVTTYTPYTISGLNGVNIYGADGNDKLTMNAEVPLAVNFYGNNGNDTLRGGNYNDNLFGNDGTDTLYGSLGNDYLDGGNGADILNGQDGNDTLVANASDPNETLINTLDGGNGADTLIGANGDDNLTGGTNNVLDGGDTIIGNGGNDKIFGGAGNDNISGGDGIDTIDGGDNNDLIAGGNANDILNGSAGDDTINGETGEDTINAGDGNDTVNGGDGNDIITGQAGDDTISGGAGNNNIQGGDGNDTITAADGNNYILGQAGNDTISVGNGNNIVVGGLGNDTITAGNGNNILIGGAGLDTITAGNGSNLIIGNSTTYDASETNLRTMQTEWLRTDITTAQKKTNLTVTGVNGVKLVQSQTVIDDLFADVINAGSGDNWLWF